MNILKKIYHNYPVPLLLLLGILVFITNLDVLMVNIMEARNFISAREMLTHNNWIFTTMNEAARYEKPPFPTWLTAISAYLFGIESLFAYRLPAAITSIFLLIIFYKLQLLLVIKKNVAFISSLILMTSFYIVFSGRDGQWDIFTHAFMMGCIYFLIRTLNSNNKKYSYALLAGLFFGASLLSKGPVSLYVLFISFLISYSLTYKFRNLKLNWKPLLLFLVIGISTGIWWTLYVHYYDAEAFAAVAELESSRWLNYNVRPFWYYWSFFTQSGIWTIPAFISLFYWYLKPRVSNLNAYKFYILWTVFSVVLLSIIPEKKSRYLLPVLIPLAMTTGFYVEYIINNFKQRLTKLERFPVYLNFIVLVIIAIGAPFVFYYFFGSTIWEKTFTYILVSISLVLIGLGLIFGLLKKKPKLLFGLQFLMILAILNFGFPLAELISPHRNSPNIKALIEYEEEENIQIYEASGIIPELIFEYGKPMPIVQSEIDLPSKANTDKFGILVHQEKELKWKENFHSYNFKLIDTLDLNPTMDKGKNSRLIREFYVLTRK
ncbi:4-amino-4-deoxy-L-arabinose transferase-like glycosyltransferase [Gillisia mitskevichiae]|uniref:4-amino-4-deoxy-L-arabinose transferase-like glycosyltransferase n=1 Tax=Gillisia mitskevichiae TaxID=270921 RepID=A0A495P557_9FLAO|nr:glycosyltransferase family 39 protein [Gillisia mitskevichiae]RKS45096.1 4-amino-4-deoxy-L-arabinose transferase-like glycosyltransferase [Gillisia mitskevichiae]